MLTLILFLRQLKSIWMSIIVNSRISFVFALMKCSNAAFGEQNKIDNDSKCQQVYKSQNYSIVSKIIGSHDSLSRSLIDAWSDVTVVHPTREMLCTYAHCEDRHCRSRMAMRGPT